MVFIIVILTSRSTVEQQWKKKVIFLLILFAGVRFGVECFTLYNIIAYCVLLLALLIGGLALGIVCHVKRDLITDREKLMKKRNIAWLKVQDALLRGGGGGQRPPASTNPPARKGWWPHTIRLFTSWKQYWTTFLESV